MLEGIQQNISRLMGLYESEKRRADELAEALSRSRQSNAESEAQILELKRQIEALRLEGALAAAGGAAEARRSIDKLVAGIDRCIRLLEY